MKTPRVLFWAIFPSLVSVASFAIENPVTYWNGQFLESVKQASTAPGLASRNLAIYHAGLHDGLATLGDSRDVFFYEFDPPRELVKGDLFVEFYSASFISIIYPTNRAKFQKRLANRTAPYSAEEIALAKTYANEVVKKAFTWRQGDGSANTLTYIPKDGIGKWRRTPPSYRPPELSHWYNVEPFVLPEASYFRPPPPPGLESEAYAQALIEVKELGDVESQERSKEGEVIANFWSCFSYTSTPAGHWNKILGDLMAKDGSMGTYTMARHFAFLNMAMADAGIAAWECKYHYEFWRPIQAIRNASLDGNPLTKENKNWMSLLEAPPHPEYVSGHSAFSGAGARVLARLFGTDEYSFSTESDEFPGEARSFKSFWQCAEECGFSRVYGGIHYNFSNTEGLALGRKVADYVFDNALK